jgi:FkbM family methyltransferase
MRLSDLGDYFRLRPFLRDPWAFLRLRSGFGAPWVELDLRGGGRVRLRDVPMDRHTFHRIFARDEYGLRGTPPGSLGTVIDVGAHIGLFALRVEPLSERVLSYEPVPANFEVLKINVGGHPGIVPVRQAVGGARETATIYVSDNPSAHSMYPSSADRRSSPTPVECVTLEDVFAQHRVDRCGLLKLDCEGAEYPLLYAVPRGFWERIDRVVMEYHPVAGGEGGWSGEGVARHLEEMGHAVRRVPSRKDPAKGHLFSRRRGPIPS